MFKNYVFFLFFYSVLLISTQFNLKIQAQSEFWLGDGTFKIVPRLFYQLYMLHGNIPTSKKAYPLVYGLMTGKSQRLYKSFFLELKSIGEKLDNSFKPKS
jgi:hypothetical protein